MAVFDATLLALNVRKWDYDSQRISLNTFFVLDDEEQSHLFDLSITQVPDMVEEFLGKVAMGCRKKMKSAVPEGEEIEIKYTNETLIRQKLYNYFRRVMMELNNPKRKRGQSRMIFTTHMDVYNESQDISFLPQIIQFFVALNWARKYYEKENYQQAVEPLRKLIDIKPDFGLGYKLLARSLKKIRRYEEAMQYYQKYAEVDNSLDAWLDLAKSYRKGKVFDKAEEIYARVLKEHPDEKEAKIGMAQIRYAKNKDGYLEILDELYQNDPGWMKNWLLKEFNFRIYISPKTLLAPHQAAGYLGYSKVFELTQKAFRNEIPSHFNPNRAKMSFFKEELDSWALVMNRFKVFPEEIVLYPNTIDPREIKPVEVDLENGEQIEQEPREMAVPEQRSSRVEAILKQIQADRERRAQLAGQEMPAGSLTTQASSNGTGQPKRRRGRPPKKKPEETVAASAESGEVPAQPKKRRGRPPKNAAARAASETLPPEPAAEPVKKRRGRPPKSVSRGGDGKNNEPIAEVVVKKKRGRPRKKVEIE